MWMTSSHNIPETSRIWIFSSVALFWESLFNQVLGASFPWIEPGHFFCIHLASYVGNFKLIQWGNACCSSLKHWLPCFLILWIRNWFPSWLLRVRSAAPHILSGSAISVISDCPQLSSGVERRSSHEILISSKLFWWIIWFVLSHFQNAIYTQAVTSRLPNTFSRGERERAFPPELFNTDRERPISQQRSCPLSLRPCPSSISVCGFLQPSELTNA